MIFKRSITAKFIATVFVVLLLAQSIGTFAFMAYMRSSFIEDINSRMSRVAYILAGVSMAPLLSYDFAMIDTYIEEVAKDEDITSVHIQDGTGKAVREKIIADDNSLSSFNPVYITKSMTVSVPVMSGGGKIGEVVLHFSGRSVNDNIRKSLMLIIAYQLIALAILGVAMTYFFNRNIKGPVAQINYAIEKITAGDLTVEVPDLGDNEIGSIAKGVSFLEQRLSVTISKIMETASDVSMALKQVDHTYKIASEGIRRQSAAIHDIVKSVQHANRQQKEIDVNIEKLLGFSTENVSSLVQIKTAAEEMASQTQRLFRSTEDSYSIVLEMSQASKSIASHASQAFSSVEDTSASIEEISASVREVNEHTGESAKIAELVKEITSGGGMMSVVNAIEGMENISDQVKNSAAIIQRLGARSIDIEKVLSVIRDVTEQTNLLSLNAAILAAQAGEYGKSFSVVADEIRALSERTAASTREIGGIVKTIQKDIKDAVYSVDTAQHKVNEGNDLVIKVGEALRDILNSSIKSSDMTKAIERASVEQGYGLRQIGTAIEDIRKVLNSVAKSTKEEESALSYLLEGVGDVKEVAEVSKRSATEQAEATRLITRNIEMANDRISQINKSIQGQKKLNADVITSMDNIGTIGSASMNDMENVSSSLKTLVNEIENLRKEMEVFKTS